MVAVVVSNGRISVRCELAQTDSIMYARPQNDKVGCLNPPRKEGRRNHSIPAFSLIQSDTFAESPKIPWVCRVSVDLTRIHRRWQSNPTNEVEGTRVYLNSKVEPHFDVRV